MSGTTSTPPGPTPNPFADLAQLIFATTEHNVTLARQWSDTVLAAYADQSDDARNTLSAVAASIEAVERVLSSQEENNRALRLSLQSYRQIVDRYATAQDRAAQLVRNSVDDLKTAGDGQLEIAKALMTASSWGAPTEVFAQMMSAWTAAFPVAKDTATERER